MAHEYPKIDPAQHQAILNDKILRDPKIFLNATPVDRPRAIITAGQPGAGKGGLVRAAKAELGGNVVTVDPDELRDKHPQVHTLRRQHPYTWSGQTHGDAVQWATELRNAAMGERKHLILDTTTPRADVIKALQARGYEVEVRVIATHRLESELGVDHRFGRGVDKEGHGRYVPREVREDVYHKLPGALDKVARQAGVPVQIVDREGHLHFDSRTAPGVSPGQALEAARQARLTSGRLRDLKGAYDTQLGWHRTLPARVPSAQVAPPTAEKLLDDRRRLGVVEGLGHDRGGVNALRGARAVPSAVKAAGVLGAAYGAYDAQQEIEAAIATARTPREQWLRGGEEAANQAAKTVVTGAAAVVGAMPGAAAGALTSPVTGPLGPIAGGLATGSAAAYGAEKLYTDSRLQRFIKFLGAQASQLGYRYFSREGRGLHQADGLKDDPQKSSDPVERQGRAAFDGEDTVQTAPAPASTPMPTSMPMRPSPISLSPEQQRHWHMAQEQLGPGLRARGHDAERIERICAAAVCHAQVHAQRGEVRAFHLSKDGEQIAVLQTYAPMSEFSVREAQATPAQQHLAQAQQTAHEQAQARTQAEAAPTQAMPARAIA